MPSYIDLFAGCGGFSTGLSRAKFEPVAKVEFDEWACQSLRANFPSVDVLEADVKTIPDETIRRYSGVDVLIGGPPCQGFSVAGSTQYSVADPRNDLFLWFLHWVTVLEPAIAVMENVPTILTKRNAKQSTPKEIVEQVLTPIGYRVQVSILNSADFGVPQVRRRAFIVAHRVEIPL